MIGRSLSFCVQQIASGLIPEDDVELIVTSCVARDTLEYNKIIASYNHTYWYDYPTAVAIATSLWKAGKIHQPRLADDSLVQDLSNMKIWVDKLSECTYWKG